MFFNHLTKEVINDIIIKELDLFIKRVNQEKGIRLKYSKGIIEKILSESYSEEYGARPVKRYIEREIGTLVARGIISKFLQPSINYLIDIEKETSQVKITTLSLLENNKNLLKEKYE